MISVIIAGVMIAISSNIALSLGLVGSLSIIRFRTVIKDLANGLSFWAIGIGVCSGAGEYQIWIVRGCHLLIFIYATFFESARQKGGFRQERYLLTRVILN